MSIYGALGLDEEKAQQSNLAVDLDVGGVLEATYGVKDPSDMALAAPHGNDPLVLDAEEDAEDGAPVENEPEYCLWAAARAFYKLPHKIIVFDQARNANCHGHTMHPGKLAWVDGSIMEEAVKSGHVTAKCCLFYRGDDLAHSGIIDGGKLVHRLIHVGVLVSEIGGSTCGYSRRFDLPEDGEALATFIEARDGAAAEHEALIQQARKAGKIADKIEQFVSNALRELGSHADRNGLSLEDLFNQLPALRDGEALYKEARDAANALYDDEPDMAYAGRVPEYGERYAAFKQAVAELGGSEAIRGCLQGLDDSDDDADNDSDQDDDDY